MTIEDAETHLEGLVERVLLGEEIVISRGGKPVARLVPVQPAAVKRRIGSAAGEFCVPDDFNAPLPPDLEDGFWR